MDRVDRQADRTVGSWSEQCHAVGVVVDAGDAEGSARTVGALIRAAASRYRLVFLVDLASSASDLASHLDVAPDDRGLAEAAAGDVSLGEVAVPDEARSFAYIPAGRTDNPAELTRSGAFDSLVERVREVGGMVLVLIDRGSLHSIGTAGWADGWVLLGESRSSGTSLPGGAPVLGTIRPRTTPDSASSDLRRRPRRRRSALASSGRIAAVGLFVVAWVGAGIFFVKQIASDGEAMPKLVRVTPEQPGREAPGGEPGSGSDATGAETTLDARDDSGSAFDSAAAPYSVLVASYASEEGARKRVEELSEASDRLFFLSPTPVQGSVWYRVYAGSRPGREEAERLMGELVDAGLKEEASSWDLRAVPWAFRLATTSKRGDAERRLTELRARGIPAYTLPVVARQDTLFRIYAGAFETEEAAELIRKRLSAAGAEAQLVRRTYYEEP